MISINYSFEYILSDFQKTIFSFLESFQNIFLMNLQNHLTWKTFFILNNSKRIYEKSIAAFLSSSSFLSSLYYFGAVAEFDPTQQVFGMIDPHFGIIILKNKHFQLLVY